MKLIVVLFLCGVASGQAKETVTVLSTRMVREKISSPVRTKCNTTVDQAGVNSTADTNCTSSGGISLSNTYVNTIEMKDDSGKTIRGDVVCLRRPGILADFAMGAAAPMVQSKSVNGGCPLNPGEYVLHSVDPARGRFTLELPSKHGKIKVVTFEVIG